MWRKRQFNHQLGSLLTWLMSDHTDGADYDMTISNQIDLIVINDGEFDMAVHGFEREIAIWSYLCEGHIDDDIDNHYYVGV